MSDEEQQKLILMMAEVSNKIQILLEKQEELADNISQIKEAVYHPDLGLYARLKELDIRIQFVETWKETNTKIMWLVGTSVVGLLIKTIWNTLF